MSATQPNTIIAIDVSGSVGNNEYYWGLVDRICQMHSDDNLTYLAWDSTCVKIPKTTLDRHIATKYGGGGTDPSVIVSYIAKNNLTCDKFVLITDGQVQNIARTEELISTHEVKFDEAQCHIIHQSPDLSVTAPFTRLNTAETFTYTGSVEPNLVFSAQKSDYAILESIDTLTYATFMSKYDLIYKLLLTATIGTSGHLAYHNQLVRAKSRMTAELAKAQKTEYNIAGQLVDGNFDTAMEMAQSIVDKYYGTSDVNGFCAKIDKLISLTLGAKNGSSANTFSVGLYSDGIKTNSYNLAAPVAVVKADEIDAKLDTTAEVVFECPILFDDDIPVIVILAGDCILKNLDKNVLETTIRNPLSILNDNIVSDKFKSRIGHPIGLSTYLHLFETTRIDPWTKRQIVGCIPLGDHPDHVKCANTTIAFLVSNGKIMGNLDLYFAVLWAMAKENGKLCYVANVSAQIERQLLYRMRNSWTCISLSGLPNMVTTRQPLGVAVWYSLVSSVLKMPDELRPIRSHAFMCECMFEMLELIKYPVTPKVVRYVYLNKQLLRLLRNSKNDFERFSDARRALYQGHIKVGNKYVFIDSAPCLAEENREKLYLMMKIDNNTAAANLSIPVDEAVLDAEIAECSAKYGSGCVNWDCGLTPPKHKPIEICLATCRPFYTVMTAADNTPCTWVDSFHEYYGFQTKYLSGNRVFGDYVVKHGKWPTVADLILMTYEKEVNKYQTTATVQCDIEYVFESIIADYELCMSSVTPAEFGARFTASVSIADRQAIESAAAAAKTTTTD